MTPEKVRPLQRSERDEATAMLTLAFDDDPLFRWFLPGTKERAAWLGWFHERAFNESHPVTGAFTLESGPSSGAILVYPPGAWPPSFFGNLAKWPLPPGIPSWRFVNFGLKVEGEMHALHPKEPHLYLYVLGVHPNKKGKGLGGTLLRHSCALADAVGAPSHLETANPDNLGLYRHFGYTVTNEITSHGGPTLWILSRPAKQADE